MFKQMVVSYLERIEQTASLHWLVGKNVLTRLVAKRALLYPWDSGWLASQSEAALQVTADPAGVAACAAAGCPWRRINKMKMQWRTPCFPLLHDF